MQTPDPRNTESKNRAGAQPGGESGQGQATISSLTQEKPTESNAIQIPEICLPKGGGALKGIDKKFEVNAANGTAGFNIPLPVTPDRNGFSPSSSLSYNSGGAFLGKDLDGDGTVELDLTDNLAGLRAVTQD